MRTTLTPPFVKTPADVTELLAPLSDVFARATGANIEGVHADCVVDTEEPAYVVAVRITGRAGAYWHLIDVLRKLANRNPLPYPMTVECPLDTNPAYATLDVVFEKRNYAFTARDIEGLCAALEP